MAPKFGARLPGWHNRSREERCALLAERLEIDPRALAAVIEHGGLSLEAADALIENVIGLHSLPFAVAPNFLINGREVLVPMVIEEPSVVAAATHGAKMLRAGAGVRVELDPPLMSCQIQVFAADLERAGRAIIDNEQDLLATVAGLDAPLVRAGGGAVGLKVRRGDATDGYLVVHLTVDVRDAMGANAVNTLGEALAVRLAEVTGGQTGISIITNLADDRLARARAVVPVGALARPGFEGSRVAEMVESASRFAARDRYRAATHNKGIMNGTDAVLLAAGNDWRAVEAGAHAYAARDGRYSPLSRWRHGDGLLEGYLEMPMAVGTVGGAVGRHPGARLALEVMGATGAAALAEVATAAGMATNLAALVALVTEGIQRGHMRLHNRSAGKLQGA